MLYSEIMLYCYQFYLVSEIVLYFGENPNFFLINKCKCRKLISSVTVPIKMDNSIKTRVKISFKHSNGNLWMWPYLRKVSMRHNCINALKMRSSWLIRWALNPVWDGREDNRKTWRVGGDVKTEAETWMMSLQTR